jgi:hypothetical protein
VIEAIEHASLREHEIAMAARDTLRRAYGIAARDALIGGSASQGVQVRYIEATIKEDVSTAATRPVRPRARAAGCPDERARRRRIERLGRGEAAEAHRARRAWARRAGGAMLIVDVRVVTRATDLRPRAAGAGGPR